MTNEDIVNGLNLRIIVLGIREYKKEFNSSKNESDLEEEWSNFYKSLSKEQGKVFFEILQRVMIDTLADTLAFFDGTYWIEGQEEDLKLVSLDDPEEILNEDLSEIFLNKHYE